MAAISVSLAIALVFAAPASAASLTNSWKAKIGSGGANGTATINVFTTGTGAIVLKLAKLKPTTSLPITVSKGTCSKVGGTLFKVAAIKTTRSGTASRTTSLTTAQVTLVKKATADTARIALRVGSSTTGGVKCGIFAALAVPPYVAAKIVVGRSPSGVVIDSSGVWVTNWWDNTLSRINPATNTVLGVVPVDFTATQGPEAIGIGAGSLWVTATEDDADSNPLPGVVKRIDPATGATIATIDVGKSPYDIEVTAGAVWVANYDSGSVMRIDPATNQVVATVPIPYASGVTVGLGAIWVVGGDGTVSRIDPATNQIVTTIPTQATGAYIATGNGAVWVTNPGDSGQSNGSLSRIDPATNQVVANTPVGANPQELAVSGTNVWIGMFGEPTVVRVSGTTNTVLNRVTVSANVYAISAASDVVWAVHNLPIPSGGTEPPAGTVSRISASGAAALVPAPTPSTTPTPTPTPTPSAGGTLIVGPYFMLAIPSGWTDEPSGNSNLLTFKGPGSQSLAAQSVPSDLTLEQVSAQVLLNIKNQGGGDPEQTEIVTMGSESGRLLTYHFVKNGLNVYQLEAFCVHNGRAFELNFANVTGGEATDRALFLNVLGSFAFLAAGY